MYNDHPRNPKYVAVVDRWSLFRGSWPQNGGRCRQVVVSSGLSVPHLAICNIYGLVLTSSVWFDSFGSVLLLFLVFDQSEDEIWNFDQKMIEGGVSILLLSATASHWVMSEYEWPEGSKYLRLHCGRCCVPVASQQNNNPSWNSQVIVFLLLFFFPVVLWHKTIRLPFLLMWTILFLWFFV